MFCHNAKILIPSRYKRYDLKTSSAMGAQVFKATDRTSSRELQGLVDTH